VWVDGGIDRARLAIVRFAPCARSHWHSHRLGQVLYIIEGVALLGSRDGTVIEAHPGRHDLHRAW
jgi:quercetin dioxygenase-like cupin family protein